MMADPPEVQLALAVTGLEGSSFAFWTCPDDLILKCGHKLTGLWIDVDLARDLMQYADSLQSRSPGLTRHLLIRAYTLLTNGKSLRLL